MNSMMAELNSFAFAIPKPFPYPQSMKTAIWCHPMLTVWTTQDNASIASAQALCTRQSLMDTGQAVSTTSKSLMSQDMSILQ